MLPTTARRIYPSPWDLDLADAGTANCPQLWWCVTATKGDPATGEQVGVPARTGGLGNLLCSRLLAQSVNLRLSSTTGAGMGIY